MHVGAQKHTCSIVRDARKHAPQAEDANESLALAVACLKPVGLMQGWTPWFAKRTGRIQSSFKARLKKPRTKIGGNRCTVEGYRTICSTTALICEAGEQSRTCS